MVVQECKPNGKVHLVMRIDKQKYTTGGKPCILIDDYKKNIIDGERGGIVIHHLSPTQTIAQLKRYGFR